MTAQTALPDAAGRRWNGAVAEKICAQSVIAGEGVKGRSNYGKGVASALARVKTGKSSRHNVRLNPISESEKQKGNQ